MNQTKIHYYVPQPLQPVQQPIFQHTPSVPQPQNYECHVNKTDLDLVRFLIGDQERVFYAGTLTRLVYSGPSESRVFVITDRFLYNIQRKKKSFWNFQLCATPSSNYRLQKRSDLSQIIAITISTAATDEFIIHFNEGKAYRFRGEQKRNQMIQAILTAHFSRKLDPILFCFREDSTFKTTQPTAMTAAGIPMNKPLLGDKILVTKEIAQKGFQWIFSNRKILLEGAANWNSSFTGSSNLSVSENIIQTGPFIGSPSTGSLVNSNGIFNQSAGARIPSFYVPEVQTPTPPVVQQQQPIVSQTILPPVQQTTETFYVQVNPQNGFPGYTNGELADIQHFLLRNDPPVQNVQIHTQFERRSENF